MLGALSALKCKIPKKFFENPDQIHSENCRVFFIFCETLVVVHIRKSTLPPPPPTNCNVIQFCRCIRWLLSKPWRPTFWSLLQNVIMQMPTMPFLLLNPLLQKNDGEKKTLTYLFYRKILFTCLSSARILWHKWQLRERHNITIKRHLKAERARIPNPNCNYPKRCNALSFFSFFLLLLRQLRSTKKMIQIRVKWLLHHTHWLIKEIVE